MFIASRSLSLVAFLALAPAAATAADFGSVPGGMPALWSGPYLGLSAGYGWGNSTQSYDRNNNHGLASTDPEGALGALTLGYNYKLTQAIVVGVEGDLGLMDVSANDKEVYDGHIYKTRFGPWWSTVRGRLGIAFDSTLIYATGGVAFMGMDEVSIGNTPGETAYNEDFKSGWVLGAGIEQALNEQVSLKVEYLHMDFGRYEGLSANREDFYFDTDVDVVRAGVNYRF